MSIYNIPTTPTHLYIKYHEITGLCYFGMTKRPDINKYLGSGTYWKNHINKHGKIFVNTLWSYLFYDEDEMLSYAKWFSLENDIVNSNRWANLMYESGVSNGGTLGMVHTDESKEKIGRYSRDTSYDDLYGTHKSNELKEIRRIAKIGNALSESTREKISSSNLGRVPWNKGKPMRESTKQKLSEMKKGIHVSKNDYVIIDPAGNCYDIIDIGIRHWFRINHNCCLPASIKNSLKTGIPAIKGKWRGWSAHVK